MNGFDGNKFIQKARARAVQQARKLVQTPELLILDTETTGLDDNAEIVDIAVIDLAGNVLLNTLVRPLRSIPRKATAIHGIRDADVAGVLSWPDVYADLQALVEGRPLAIYNAAYDLRMIRQTTAQYPGLVPPAHAKSTCVMELFAKYRGDWSKSHGKFRWVKLSEAARSCGVKVKEAHRAWADCLMTKGVLLYLAGR